MNFGQVGRELLQELKRSEWLPLYSEDAVSRCILVRGCACLWWSLIPRLRFTLLPTDRRRPACPPAPSTHPGTGMQGPLGGDPADAGAGRGGKSECECARSGRRARSCVGLPAPLQNIIHNTPRPRTPPHATHTTARGPHGVPGGAYGSPAEHPPEQALPPRLHAGRSAFHSFITPRRAR